LVGFDDTVTGRDKGGAARLELHAVNDELEPDVVAAVSVVLVRVKTVDLDEVEVEIVEGRAPSAALGVHTRVLVAVDVRVSLGVDGEVIGVVVETDAIARKNDCFSNSIFLLQKQSYPLTKSPMPKTWSLV